MHINNCNKQECYLNKSGIKVDNISAVEKNQICLGCFCIWTVFIQCSKKFNHNKGAKAKSYFEGNENKEDDDTYLIFNFDDEKNKNRDQLFF